MPGHSSFHVEWKQKEILHNDAVDEDNLYRQPTKRKESDQIIIIMKIFYTQIIRYSCYSYNSINPLSQIRTKNKIKTISAFLKSDYN